MRPAFFLQESEDAIRLDDRPQNYCNRLRPNYHVL